MPQDDPPPPDLLAALVRMGLLAPAAPLPEGARLTGGVSSDIWRIDLPTGPICVKRALPKLRVAADWHAPIERNRFEAAWMARATAARPGAAPALLGQDPQSGALAMAYLSPTDHPLWKDHLHAGHADPVFAAQVGATIAAIHAASAADPTTAAEFPTDQIFHDIRLEPYLLATARTHPDRAKALTALAATTTATKRALVHGDVSPKNILAGPDGPVLLDAECAWYGDPAFDLAFCLNHLLLKCLWVPAAAPDFVACFEALARAYLERVDWEPAAALEARAASLLPGLLLARVDGKSPVEYLTETAAKERVRRCARALLLDPPARLAPVLKGWRRELAT